MASTNENQSFGNRADPDLAAQQAGGPLDEFPLRQRDRANEVQSEVVRNRWVVWRPLRPAPGRPHKEAAEDCGRRRSAWPCCGLRCARVPPRPRCRDQAKAGRAAPYNTVPMRAPEPPPALWCGSSDYEDVSSAPVALTKTIFCTPLRFAASTTLRVDRNIGLLITSNPGVSTRIPARWMTAEAP